MVGLVWSDGQNFMQPIIFATLVASDITDSIVILLLQFTYFTASELGVVLRAYFWCEKASSWCKTTAAVSYLPYLQNYRNTAARFITKCMILQCRGVDSRARAKPQCPLNCSDKSADWLLLWLTALFSQRTKLWNWHSLSLSVLLRCWSKINTLSLFFEILK